MKPILILAPIRGITDQIYRNVFQNYFTGFDYAVAPFIATSRQKSIDRRTLREFEMEGADRLKTIPQILSNNPEDFVQMANALHDIGHRNINWNLGCPFPMITKKKKGSGLLCYPHQIESFLEKVMPSVRSAVSIKLRLGFEHTDDIFNLIPIFNDFPLEDITIHPRTGKQMYTGMVDMESFGRCVELSRHEVVFNGDIMTKIQLEDLSARFPGIKKWMIGRGALINPFLTGEIRGNAQTDSFNKKKEIIHRFHDDLFKEYSRTLHSPSHVLDRMKGHWFYLERFFPDGGKIFKRIKKIQNPRHYQDEIDRVFKPEREIFP